MKAILGKKIGMTRVFDTGGKVSAVTVIQAGPCVITQIKNLEKDGYQALQIGYGQKKNLNKPCLGHLKKSASMSKFIREIKSDQADYKVGDQITVEMFHPGDKVSVVGVSKGKGFAGTVKRHGFTTGPKTHGSCNYRKPGSIGDTGPQRVIKGKRMSGHMGVKKTTIEGLEVKAVDIDKNLLVVKGSIPGSNQGLIMIKGK